MPRLSLVSALLRDVVFVMVKMILEQFYCGNLAFERQLGQNSSVKRVTAFKVTRCRESKAT